jgi:hypothetical protein
MRNEPSHEALSALPKLYETEEIPFKDKVIHLHFFIGSSDFYFVEFDGEDLFWGFVVLNADLQMAEWGYSSFYELQSINVRGLQVDCDINWTPRPASEVELICKAQNWIGHE